MTSPTLNHPPGPIFSSPVHVEETADEYHILFLVTADGRHVASAVAQDEVGEIDADCRRIAEFLRDAYNAEVARRLPKKPPCGCECNCSDGTCRACREAPPGCRHPVFSEADLAARLEAARRAHPAAEVALHVFTDGIDQFVADPGEALRAFEFYAETYGCARLYVDADEEGESVYEDCLASYGAYPN